MDEKDTIQALINQAANTKRLLDKLNRAAYGYTMGEAVGKEASREADTKGSAGLPDLLHDGTGGDRT